MKILLPTLHVRPSAQATPLAAACLKAALPEPFRSGAELLNFYLEQAPEQMLKEILQRHPDIVAFPLYLWNRGTVLELSRRLRQHRPDIYLLAGGPEASADCSSVITEGALDAVICGEGEEAFAALISALADDRPVGEIPGVVTKKVKTPQAVYCEDLDRLPSPYLQRVLTPGQGDGLLWEVARGCPFNCTFCYDAKGQQGVRPLSMDRLEEELKWFVARGAQQIWILDSTFNFPAERGRALLELLLKTAPGIHYHLEAKAEFLDRETIRLLSRLHCSVQVGLQSADPQVLKPLHRTFDPGELFLRLEQLSEAGITFGLDLIYGLPGDNYRGFSQSLNTALLSEPNQVDMFPLAVLPGTILHLQQKELGLEAMQSPPYEILSSPGYPAEEMHASRRLAAATDIFYNRGRAVGFTTFVCEALALEPARLMENFSDWLQQGQENNHETEDWTPELILPLQKEFLAEEFEKHGNPQLVALCHDLLSYHFHYAETLLGPELAPPQITKVPPDAWQQCWVCSDRLTLVDFTYELDELLAAGGMSLENLYKALQPTGSSGLFIRRGQDVLCEALQDDFTQLLKKSTGEQSPAEILPHYNREEGMEILEFALIEGLLLKR